MAFFAAGFLAAGFLAAGAGASSLSTQAVHKIKQRIRDRLRAAVARQIEDEEANDEWGA